MMRRVYQHRNLQQSQVKRYYYFVAAIMKQTDLYKFLLILNEANDKHELVL